MFVTMVTLLFVYLDSKSFVKVNIIIHIVYITDVKMF